MLPYLRIVIVLVRQTRQSRVNRQFGWQHFPPDGHAPLRGVEDSFQFIVQDVSWGHEVHHFFIAEKTSTPLESNRSRMVIISDRSRAKEIFCFEPLLWQLTWGSERMAIHSSSVRASELLWGTQGAGARDSPKLETQGLLSTEAAGGWVASAVEESEWR